MAICGRVFAPLSRFGVAAGAAMRTIFRNGTVVRLRLAFTCHMVGARCEGLFLQRLAPAHLQEKEKARSDERA